jgi:hypothetical protein
MVRLTGKVVSGGVKRNRKKANTRASSKTTTKNSFLSVKRLDSVGSAIVSSEISGGIEIIS